MKKLFLFPIFLIFVGITFQSCLEDQCQETRTFIQYEPVILNKDQMRGEIKAVAPKSLESPGKIYFYNNYILVAEMDGGIHFINNSDPANPQVEAFLELKGNRDMAIKDNTLLVDNYVDLLAIDITDIQNPVLKHTEEDVFESFYVFQEGGFIVDYVPTQETITIDCTDPRWGRDILFIDNLAFVNNDAQFAGGRLETISNASNNGGQTGTGGSLSRFTTYLNKYFYTIDDINLNVFDISDACNPSFLNKVDVGWGIETIYPYEDKLFIGANDGMYIFDNSNPQAPSQITRFAHARSCDPVVVEENTAYVTLRGGSVCQGFLNQLDIIDVTSYTNPLLLATHPMDGPYGLAILNKILYICDGESGLKVYDVQDPENIELLDHVKGLNTYDVIALANDILLVIGADGFYQFDASDKRDVVELSRIPVQRP